MLLLRTCHILALSSGLCIKGVSQRLSEASRTNTWTCLQEGAVQSNDLYHLCLVMLPVQVRQHQMALALIFVKVHWLRASILQDVSNIKHQTHHVILCRGDHCLTATFVGRAGRTGREAGALLAVLPLWRLLTTGNHCVV